MKYLRVYSYTAILILLIQSSLVFAQDASSQGYDFSSGSGGGVLSNAGTAAAASTASATSSGATAPPVAATGASAASGVVAETGAGKGLGTTAMSMQSSISALNMAVDESLLPKVILFDFTLYQDLADYKVLSTSCIASHETATNACLESLSPNIQGAIVGVNLIASTLGVVTTDTCSKFSKMMDVAKKGMTLFTVACGVARSSCSSSCEKAVAKLQLMKSKVAAMAAAGQQTSPPINAFNAEAAKELAPTGNLSVAGKLAVCGKDYGMLLTSAGVGIVQMITSMKAGSSCKDQSNGAGTVNCEDPAQASTITCVCEKNPRLAGCANGLDKAILDSNVTPGFSTSPVPTASTDGSAAAPNLGFSGGSDPFSNEKAGGGGSGAGGGLSGGSAGGMDGGDGLSNSGNEAANGLAPKTGSIKLNDGNAGSGGGSGRSVSSWGMGSYMSPSARAALLKSNPAKAQSLALASQFKKEVTSGEGQSNWEKVKNRYRDNVHTLMGR